MGNLWWSCLEFLIHTGQSVVRWRKNGRPTRSWCAVRSKVFALRWKSLISIIWNRRDTQTHGGTGWLNSSRNVKYWQLSTTRKLTYYASLWILVYKICSSIIIYHSISFNHLSSPIIIYHHWHLSSCSRFVYFGTIFVRTLRIYVVRFRRAAGELGCPGKSQLAWVQHSHWKIHQGIYKAYLWTCWIFLHFFSLFLGGCFFGFVPLDATWSFVFGIGRGLERNGLVVTFCIS